MEIIELPKVKGSILTYGQAHDYKRRIPTYRNQKQKNRDEKIVRQIIRAWDVDEDPDKVLDIFFAKQHLLSDPVYWETLRTVWIACGTGHADRFRPLFNADRRAKSWLMTIEDKEYLDSLDYPIILFRARHEDDHQGISWTDDLDWCMNYAKTHGLQVYHSKFYRNEITAYFSRRGESEFIILPLIPQKNRLWVL